MTTPTPTTPSDAAVVLDTIRARFESIPLDKVLTRTEITAAEYAILRRELDALRIPEADAGGGMFAVNDSVSGAGYEKITFMPYRAHHDQSMQLSIRHAGGDTQVRIANSRDAKLWEQLRAVAQPTTPPAVNRS